MTSLLDCDAQEWSGGALEAAQPAPRAPAAAAAARQPSRPLSLAEQTDHAYEESLAADREREAATRVRILR